MFYLVSIPTRTNAVVRYTSWDRSCFNLWDVNYGKCEYKDFVEQSGRCKSIGFNCFSALYHREALLEVVSILKATFAEQQSGQQGHEQRPAQHELAKHAVSACKVAHELAKKGYVTRATLQDLVFVSEPTKYESLADCKHKSMMCLSPLLMS